ncbi:MAG: asparagine synthase (glutamine-hydrolyzing) [Verrucomicrobiales bacterium]
MCGILAVIGRDPGRVDVERLRRSNDLVKHRGPDGSGVWVGKQNGVGLAHRRLAILDLSDQGAQPMVGQWEGAAAAERGDECVITYNGEVFNYRELRSELEGLGHRFRSETDTEVVLAAYRQWGVDCVNRFNGMWAFAIYDTKREIVFASRDRFGIKPLYFHRSGESLVLSSEIRQILPWLGSRRVDGVVLFEYLLAGFLEHRENTFFEGVRKIEAGHRLVHDLRSGETKVERWYRLRDEPEEGNISLDAAARRVRTVLESSVRLRLRSDVKAGTCLSGGIDSSAIASLASETYRRETGEPFCAIHATGGDAESDESAYARQVAEARGLELHLVEPRYEDFLESLEAVVESQEEPFGSTSVFMQYFVMRKAREIGCLVMLDGQGGDEVFLGYEKYFPAGFLAIARRNPLRAWSEMRMAMRNNAGMSLRGVARYSLGSFFGNARYRVHRWQAPFLRSAEKGIPLLGEISRAYRDPFAIQRLEVERSNLPVLLRYEDRNSMAHSVEARVPFLDHRLVELAANLPFDYKLHRGWAKYVFRKAIEDIVPAENLWRREKFGFNSPHEDWMRRHRDRALDEIGDSTLLRSCCDMDVLRNRFDELDPRMRWRLYNTALWERIFAMKPGNL